MRQPRSREVVGLTQEHKWVNRNQVSCLWGHSLFVPYQWFSNRGSFALQRTFSNIWRYFGSHNWGGGCYWPLEARDAAKHLTTDRTAPKRQRIIQFKMPGMPALRNPGLDRLGHLGLPCKDTKKSPREKLTCTLDAWIPTMAGIPLEAWKDLF